MRARRRLGQHFLVSGQVAQQVVDAAHVLPDDTVFEAGTGRGALTGMLCKRARRVISVEADPELARAARESLGGTANLELREGDAFCMDDAFDVFVSSLPYSRSRDAVEWMAQRDFGHGAVMVQEEFAAKMTAGPAERRAVGVIASHCLEVSRVAGVGRNSFDPPPRVDSAILRIKKRSTLDAAAIRAVNRMFSYRRKTLRGVMRQFGMECAGDGRLEDMSADEVAGLAEEIARR